MRLALGTAHFGQDYGAFTQGQVGVEEASAILDTSTAAGIGMIDTAHAYGTSESLLGRLGAAEQFCIVTKIPDLGEGPGKPDRLIKAFDESLDRLSTDRVHGLIVHRASDLESDEADQLWRALERLRDEGRAGRIGVSVYTPDEAARLLGRYPLSILQCPLNLFDQRFARSGMLEQLKDSGVEVHARSLFLQGFLLADPMELPAHLQPFAERLAEVDREAVRAQVSRLSLALSYARSMSSVDFGVVGAANHLQIQEIAAAADGPCHDVDWLSFAVDDMRLINPMLWH